MARYTLEAISLDECGAVDIANEYRRSLALLEEAELYRVHIEGDTRQACYMVWLPELRLGGVAWGADADWHNADSPMAVVELALGTVDEVLV